MTHTFLVFQLLATEQENNFIIKLMRLTLISTCLFNLGILVACQADVRVTPVKVTPTDPLSSHENVRTLTPETRMAIDRVAEDQAVTPISPLTNPTQTFELCSPLSLHPLAELPDIISDPYDPPPPGREERHHGVDFSYWHYQDRDSMLGEPVQAILQGTVITAIQDLYPYGNMVIIETRRKDLPGRLIAELQIGERESLYHLYAHMNQPPAVGLGESVAACQLLGEVGMSGNTDIPHLHLETRIGPAGTTFASMRFYDTRATIAEMEAYKRWRTSGEFRHFDPMKLLTFPSLP
jgi:murein DD-endopeptidase MepM/ murein hydrolase activator NlpD